MLVVWLVKSTAIIIALWIMAKWIVEDHVAHVEMSRRMYWTASMFGGAVCALGVGLVVVLPWFELVDGVCMLVQPSQSGILLGVWCGIHALMFLFALLQAILSMSHTLKGMVHVTAPLTQARFGLVSVLSVSAIHLFLQTTKYFIWTVLVLTLNADVYHKQTALGHATLLSTVKSVTVQFDQVVLWLDVIGLVVMALHFPKDNDFLAIDKYGGWDAERQYRKMSMRPPPLTKPEPFVVRPSEKKDDVLFVAPTNSPYGKTWGSPLAATNTRDAQLLHHDVLPEEDFTVFQRQSIADQTNIFAAVSALPIIQEHDDESLHDVLMSDDDN
jgi:hypothetical protein